MIGISSGKGGVGKSSVTVNLAVALAARGHDVGLLDADVYGFSVPKMLGVTRGPVAIDELLVPPVVHGVRCLSMGFFVPDEQPVIWRGPMLHKALEQFLVDAYWGEPDFLLIDMPPGTGDVALSLGQYLPRTEIVVVTTPQPPPSGWPSARPTRPRSSSWRCAASSRTCRGSPATTASATSSSAPVAARPWPTPSRCRCSARSPSSPTVRVGGDTGVPVRVADPDGEAALAFDALATRWRRSARPGSTAGSSTSAERRRPPGAAGRGPSRDRRRRCPWRNGRSSRPRRPPPRDGAAAAAGQAPGLRTPGMRLGWSAKCATRARSMATTDAPWDTEAGRR